MERRGGVSVCAMTSLLRRAGAPIAAVAMVFVVSACGGDGSADSDSTASASSSEPAAPTDDASTGGTDTSPPETTAATPTTPATDATGSGDGGAAPDTVDGAIARYEAFLHALGTKDVPTMCDVAGPAAQQAEAEGVGPCESSMAMMAEMPSPEQSEALRTATIDSSLVVSDTPGTVTIPPDAIVSSATFSESDIGTMTLVFQNGNWFIVA